MNTLTRWARHLWLDADDARRTLTATGLQRLEAAVQASEARHLGELRLCVEGGLPAPLLWQGCTPRQRAIDLFSQLRVWDTEHNNGVLIYLLLAERRIEILADRGLMQRVPEAQWQALTQALGSQLKAGRVKEGLCQAIERVGALLHLHYPLRTAQDNVNELPNAVVLL